MKAITDTGIIDDKGKLQLTHREKFAAAIAAHPGKAVEITVAPVRNGISHRQRKYFFGVVCDILQLFFESTGITCTKQNVADLLKDRFLFREVLCPITGRFIKIPISLSDSEGAMTKEEFQKAYAEITQWASEKLNLEIPSPDPNWKMYKNEKGDIQAD